MKNIYIIVQSNPDYAIDWNAFKRPKNSVFILIGDDVSAGDAEKSEAFAAIYRTNKFDVDALSDCIDDVYAVYCEYEDKVSISTVSEYDVLTCAELRERYSMDGPGRLCLEHFRNKLLMKSVVSVKGLRVPKHILLNYADYKNNYLVYLRSLEQSLGYPMFAKPVDGASSVDTAMIRNRGELMAWIVSHQASPRVMEIEEFIEGGLFHCDTVVQDGKCLQTFVSRYLHPNAAALQGKPLASLMLQPTDPDFARLKNFAEDVLKSFPDLPNGCNHLEVFKSSKTGELVFLEVGARPAGGKVPEMYAIHTQGVDLRALHHYLSLQIPIPNELIAKLKAPKGPYAAMFIMVNPPAGGLVSGRIQPEIESEFKLVWKCKEGDLLRAPLSNNDMVGSLVFSNSDYEILAADFQALNSYVPLKLNEQECYVGEPQAYVSYQGVPGLFKANKPRAVGLRSSTSSPSPLTTPSPSSETDSPAESSSNSANLNKP